MATIIVMMSSYNGERYIRKQIDSILNQKDVDVKLVVRDDGSTDRTLEILEEYSVLPNFYWYTGENLRPAKSFMDLLMRAEKYDYYAFADQDDVWDEDKLISGITVLKKYNSPACYHCNARLIDENDVTFGTLVYKTNSSMPEEKTLENELCMAGAMGCTMIMNHDFISIVQTGKIPNALIMHDCYLEALCKSIGGDVVFDPVDRMGYRQHENNVIGRKSGIASAIKYRLDFLRMNRVASIADQAAHILHEYEKYIPSENIGFVKTVAEYKSSFFRSFMLAISNKIKINGLANNIFIRLSLLLQKR